MKKIKNTAGFTIIELLIAIAVVGIAVPSLIVFVSTLDKLNDQARDLVIINSTVENKVESLRSIGFLGVVDGTTDFTSELPDTISPPRSATYTVSSIDSALKEVNVTVTYDLHGEAKELEYRTYIGELGVGQY